MSEQFEPDFNDPTREYWSRSPVPVTAYVYGAVKRKIAEQVPVTTEVSPGITKTKWVAGFREVEEMRPKGYTYGLFWIWNDLTKSGAPARWRCCSCGMSDDKFTPGGLPAHVAHGGPRE